jgi:hypothetical protein
MSLQLIVEIELSVNNHSSSSSEMIYVAILLAGIGCLVLVISPSTLSNQIIFAAQQSCTTGWYITGYSTPVERDYNGTKQIIKVVTPTSVVQNREFYKSFLHDVEVEGWGRTLAGDYIGLVTNDRQWHSSPKPIGSTDEPLLQHTVAVDPNFIQMGQKLIIPTLPSPWNETTLTAADVGPDIKGKHVDVYTGEGKYAGKETYRITGHDNELCLK